MSSFTLSLSKIETFHLFVYVGIVLKLDNSHLFQKFLRFLVMHGNNN